MRVSEGVPKGRYIQLYHPEMFQEYEEVIVFNMDEFQRTYSSIEEHICHINRTYLRLDGDDEWKLLGYWPKIIDRVHLLDLNINSFFKSEPLQCYLDAYIHKIVQNPGKEVLVTEKEAVRTEKVSDQDLLL